MAQFFAVESGTTTTSSGGTASPRSGNIDPVEVASLLLDQGASIELATNLLAIAERESGFISDNINFNGAGDGSSGDGSYDLGLFQINTVHAPGATNSGRGLPGPLVSSATKLELQAFISQ